MSQSFLHWMFAMNFGKFQQIVWVLLKCTRKKKKKRMRITASINQKHMKFLIYTSSYLIYGRGGVYPRHSPRTCRNHTILLQGNKDLSKKKTRYPKIFELNFTVKKHKPNIYTIVWCVAILYSFYGTVVTGWPEEGKQQDILHTQFNNIW